MHMLNYICNHMLVGINIVSVQKTNNLSARQMDPFVHRIINPLIGLGNKVGNMRAMTSHNTLRPIV